MAAKEELENELLEFTKYVSSKECLEMEEKVIAVVDSSFPAKIDEKVIALFLLKSIR